MLNLRWVESRNQSPHPPEKNYNLNTFICWLYRHPQWLTLHSLAMDCTIAKYYNTGTYSKYVPWP